MKSDKRLDEQIKAVADLWNYTSPAKGVNDPANLIASAVYDTLRWARGCRVKDPSAALIRNWERLREL